MNVAALSLAASVATLGAVFWLAAREPAAPSQAPSDPGAPALRDEIRALRDETRSLRDEVAALRRARTEGAQPAAGSESRPGRAAAASPSAPGAPASEAGGTPTTDDLADRVAEKLQARLDARAEKVAGREYSDDGRWKAPIDELSGELKLTDAQKDALKGVFDRARDQAYLLLKTQRLDGGTLLDDYANALKNQIPPEEATRELFRRIVSDKVPGSDETYLASFIAIGAETNGAAAKHLDPAQAAKFRALRVDVLDVKTGYDPVGDYIRAAVQ